MSTNMPEQSAANHTRLVPAFHYVGAPLTVAYLIWSTWRMFTLRTADDAMHLIVAVILAIALGTSRTFVLAVQDRLIRLEERLRFARLLPADMQSRIEEFTPRQLIALRFASDAELPALARRVLDENMNDPKAIKAAVKEWRADHMRA